MRARLVVQCSALAAILCGGTLEAAARPSDDLIKQGLEQRRKGNDREALELFKRAYAIDPAPRNLAQVGFAEQALGVWAAAETHLRAALARGDDPWIKKNQAALRKSIGAVAAHLGSLEVWGTPKGAEVIVNGVAAGVLPLPEPLRLTAGTVSVAVRADGFVELTRIVAVPVATIAREQFDLPRQTVTAVASDPTPTAGTGSSTPPLLSARAEHDEERETSRPVWKRWWFWTAVGAVAVAGGAAAFVLLRPTGHCMSTTEHMCDGI